MVFGSAAARVSVTEGHYRRCADRKRLPAGMCAKEVSDAGDTLLPQSRQPQERQ